jgi:hypothetical protein
VDDEMPLVIWTCNFLEVQGFKVHDNAVFQYNQSVPDDIELDNVTVSQECVGEVRSYANVV